MLQIEKIYAFTLSEKEAKIITRFYRDIIENFLEDSAFDILEAIESRATSWDTYNGRISFTYTNGAEDE